MHVRYSYLKDQFAAPDEILERIKEVVVRGDFTLGAELDRFEQNFAELIGAQFAVGVNSGTDALMLSLKAVGVGFGDEVITAANTFIATAGAINALGARPVFVDVTPYYTLDAGQVEDKITERTKALLPVHLTGEPADMDDIMSLSKKYDIPVIEDACQAILSEFRGKRAGTFGEMAGFSLHPLKNLNVWGDSGVIVTNSESHYNTLRLLRNHGMVDRDQIAMFGFNSRLDTIQAVVGNCLIDQVVDITKKRINHARRYDEAWGAIPQIRLPQRRDDARRVFHLYIIETDQRDDLYEFLLDKGVSAKIHYPIPLFLQAGLKHLGYKPGDFPVTELQADQILSLPVDQHLSEEQQQFVIDTIRSFFK